MLGIYVPVKMAKRDYDKKQVKQLIAIDTRNRTKVLLATTYGVTMSAWDMIAGDETLDKLLEKERRKNAKRKE